MTPEEQLRRVLEDRGPELTAAVDQVAAHFRDWRRGNDGTITDFLESEKGRALVEPMAEKFGLPLEEAELTFALLTPSNQSFRQDRQELLKLIREYGGLPGALAVPAVYDAVEALAVKYRVPGRYLFARLEAVA